MASPLIGILLDYEKSGSFSTRPHYALRKTYFDAIFKAGGTPIGLPYIRAEISNYIATCDGFLFPGGFYPFPSFVYNANKTGKKIAHPRYHFESALMRAALTKDIPVLGVCAGMQVIAAIFGCKLFRDIKAETSTKIDHLNGSPAEKKAHKISITRGTLLETILGVQKLQVNSAHNESIRMVTKNILINAIAPDGIVEGIEVPKHRFCLGVQWHPEFFLKKKNTNINLFEALVCYAQNKDYVSPL